MPPMPEEGIETDDLKERLEEVSERIEGEARLGTVDAVALLDR